MGSLVQSRRQVWIAQSPLSESCRAALHQLPLVLGQIFGPAAQEALDRMLVASEARCQLREQQASFKVPGYSPYSSRRATFPSRRQISGRGLPQDRSYRVQQFRPYGSPLRPYHRSRHATAASDHRPPKDIKSARRQRWLAKVGDEQVFSITNSLLASSNGKSMDFFYNFASLQSTISPACLFVCFIHQMSYEQSSLRIGW